MGWADRLMASSGWGPNGAYWAINVSYSGACGPLLLLVCICAWGWVGWVVKGEDDDGLVF
jgi:hypothetical protein